MKRWCMAVLLLAACDGGTGPGDSAMFEGGFTAIAAGGEHNCALTVQGSAFCWGEGRSGQLGTADTVDQIVPGRIAGSLRFSAISAGLEHTCALTHDGTLYCWGANWRGQLGNGSHVNQLAAIPIMPALRFREVSAGWFHTCALSTAGEAYCWGANGQGQLGITRGDDVTAPAPVLPTLRFRSLSAGGFHTCGIDSDGRPLCWGANNYGQLGDGSTTDSHEPRPLAGATTYVDISAGFTHSCGIESDGGPMCWGSSDHGELGAGAASPAGWAGSTTPVAVRGVGEAVRISAGYHVGCMIDDTQIVSCWGRGVDGQLGSGSRMDAWTPQFISIGDAGIREPRLTDVGLGLSHGCGVSLSGAAFCWGQGRSGQLGAGSRTFSTLAVRVLPAR